ncbi:uncharacterized protein EDB93DRAFT_1263214 [Suillus bovinus]|uniref:uncharacterized protein n=1 Tax=Suillus bovinus TaxID=48563 RepID=UPI001B885385|nr:uncharacterized protein EDB93DRAFT_1263214 [Suillus bovinus]KAG2130792.1 hypothetical protein EDB93DRAFT_1263214 [Suillus bovinus]
MSEDNRPDPPETCEATIRESSTARFRILNVADVVQKRSKRSRDRTPATQSVNLQPGVSSNQTIARRPGYFTTGTFSHVSRAEETSGPKSVDAELQGAHEASEHMKTLWRPAHFVISAVNNAADDFQTNYLQPLKLFDAAIENIANVHPYAKMALGVLSAAAKIILSQAERDESVDRLLQKLDEVYGFITQDDNLSKVESMHDIIGKIAQQTLECARFIREYSDEELLEESW